MILTISSLEGVFERINACQGIPPSNRVMLINKNIGKILNKILYYQYPVKRTQKMRKRKLALYWRTK